MHPFSILHGNGYKRIYFYHIRKCGGTSLYKAFLTLGGEGHEIVYKRLLSSPLHRVLSGKLVFAGWNPDVICSGSYDFAYSHIEKYNLKLADDTYTLVMLRNPIKRLLSHYKMLIDFRGGKSSHPSFETEKHWLGNTFEDFLRKIPKIHLLRELSMFSREFNIAEAFEEIISCNKVMLLETYEQDLQSLNKTCDLSVPYFRSRKSKSSIELNQNEFEMLEDKLQPEIILYRQVCKYKERILSKL